MRRFFNKLFRDSRATSSAWGGRRAPRRPALQLEILEDRLVPTSVSLSGSILTISNAGPSDTVTFQGYGNDGMQVLDNGHSVYTNTNKQSIGLVNLYQNGSTVVVNDSNGMPFGYGTTINLLTSSGGGPGSLALEGSRTVSGNELYVEGGTPSTTSTVLLDNLTFQWTGSIYSVTDTINITGTYQVATAVQGVVLTNGAIGEQTLDSYPPNSFSPNSILNFAGKPVVEIDEYAQNAAVFLNATQPETGEQVLSVIMENASGDYAEIDATPAGLAGVNVVALGSDASVSLIGNQSFVYIGGNSSTTVFIGAYNPQVNDYSTQGIQASVEVFGAASLFVDDHANSLAPSDVTLTTSTISGTGLFGNNGVTINFGDVAGDVIVLAKDYEWILI
jgi:hypothetical protein